MATSNNSNNTPNVRVYDEPGASTTASTTSGEPVAERFIHKELGEARKSLRLTQILACVGTLGIMLYTGYIANHLNQTLQPAAAAEVATGLIKDQVDTQAPQIAMEIRTRVPKLIEQLPDYAIKQIPQYRAALESQVENDMTKYFTSSSKELGDSFDDLLSAHKDSIGQMLKDGKDPQAMKQVGDALEQELTKYVTTAAVNGETLSTKLDSTYDSLTQINKRMAKLAANQNLTTNEKKARRAIGILTRTVNAAGPEAGATTNTI